MRNWIFLLSLLLATPAATQSPTHVVIVVVDQLRPDYLEKYDLPNLRALKKESTVFSNAHVGHQPSVTLMSHPAISTGVFPKHFGWNGDVYHDVHGWLGEKGAW